MDRQTWMSKLAWANEGVGPRCGQCLIDLQGSHHEKVQQGWIPPGPVPGSVVSSTSSKNKIVGELKHGLWLCRDQGVIPVSFAGLSSSGRPGVCNMPPQAVAVDRFF